MITPSPGYLLVIPVGRRGDLQAGKLVNSSAVVLYPPIQARNVGDGMFLIHESDILATENHDG